MENVLGLHLEAHDDGFIILGTIFLWVCQNDFRAVLGDAGITSLLPVVLLFSSDVISFQDAGQFCIYVSYISVSQCTDLWSQKASDVIMRG